MGTYSSLGNEDIVKAFESESIHLGELTEAISKCAQAGYSVSRYGESYRTLADTVEDLHAEILNRLEK